MDARRFRKTALGQEEIAGVRKTLKGKLRTALFLVEETRSADDIVERFRAIGAPIDALAQLADGGYIEAPNAPATAPSSVAAVAAAASPAQPGHERLEASLDAFRTAKALMNDAIVDALGLRAFTFTLKLERCATSRDLAALLPAFAEALARRLNPTGVRTIVGRVEGLIGARAG